MDHHVAEQAAAGAAVELAKNRDLALKASTSLGEALTALAAREEEEARITEALSRLAEVG